MFDTINGIPLHPLVVHGVVVLLPLTILGTIAIAVRPVWRRSYGLVVLGIGIVATGLIPVATSSGEDFEKRVGDPGDHARLGDQLLWFALPMLVLLVVLVAIDRGVLPANPISSATGVKVVAALSVVAALAAGFQVYRVGDSGAKAVWCGSGNPNYTCTTAR